MTVIPDRIRSHAAPAGLPPRANEAALYVAAAALCCALGAVIATGPAQAPIAVWATAAAAGAAAVLRWPALALVGVLVLATFSGRSGAHWLVPELDIPLFETLLVLGGAAALLHLLSSRTLSAVPSTVVLMLWIPSAVWGAALFLLDNESDLISGLRESALFVYPALVALPLVATRPASLRRFVEDRGWILIALLALGVAALGAANLAQGDTINLAGGEVRSLGAEHSPALAGGVFVALWQLEARRRRAAAIVLLIASLAGLVFVNHRSAYVALVVAAAVFVLLHVRPRRDPDSARLGSALLIAAILAGALLVTPLGQSGLNRFLASFETDDPTVQFRFEAISAAVEKDDALEAVLGSGVGLQETDLSGDFDPMAVSRIEAHNSYISVYQRGGLVGAVLMLAPLIYCFREMARQRARPEIRVLLSISVFTLVMAGFNVVLENMYFGLWCWLPLLAATAVAIQRRVGSGGHERR